MLTKITTTTAALACMAAAMAPGTATAATTLPTPAGLRAITATSSSMTLHWRAVAGASAYRVMMSTQPNLLSGRMYHDFTTTTGVMVGLRSTTRYYYRVAVINRVAGARISAFTAPAYPNYVSGPVGDASMTPAPTPTSTASYDLRAASYNVQSISLDKTVGEQRPWKERQAGVVAHINGEHVDVMGLQEASQVNMDPTRVVDGPNQFLDIRNGLNKVSGGNYQVTTDASYNCVNPSSSYKCTYQSRGASNGDHILYNADTLTMLSHGSYLFKTQAAVGALARYLTYATFQVNTTGQQFFFVSTHLDADRATEWPEVVQQINAHKGTLPVVSVGDYNTQKYDPIAADLLPTMKRNGYGDVLNQEYRQNPVLHPRAEKTVNGWVYSFNHDYRDVHKFSCDKTTKIGNNIDLMFASNNLRVKVWKVVVDFNTSTMMVNGVIASDHNMVSAVITLP
jgi:endonuclease/exonuclease/phosphatase family metal-dependent hydrolase